MGRFARWLLPSSTDWLSLALVFWLFAAGSGWSALLADGDTGWHIRAGEYVLDHRQVPSADLFSYTKPGRPWCAWEWGADVIFALAWRACALKGVVLLAGTILAAYLTVLFRHMLWRAASFFPALGVCLLASGASAIHYLARPHVFTLLFLAGSLWLLDADRTAPGRRVWLLVPLTAVWANLHAGFTALLACLALRGAGALLERDRLVFRRSAALLGACSAASLANPYGIGLHRHVLEYLRSGWIRQAVEEFQAPRFRSESALQFEILLFAGLLVAAWLLRQRRFGDAALVLFWAHAALSSARHIPVFCIVTGPLVASEAAAWRRGRVAAASAGSWWGALARLDGDMAAAGRRASAWPALAVTLLAAGLLPARWPSDFPEAKFPVRLVERHEAALRGRRVFTSDQWGDYLLFRWFPVQRVFIDGRSDFYGPETGQLYLKTAYGGSGWSATLDSHDIGLVLAPRDWPLADLLGAHRGWTRVDGDSSAVLFARRQDDALKNAPPLAELCHGGVAP